jgi:glutamate/aspartate transport system substrate-binding protein
LAIFINGGLFLFIHLTRCKTIAAFLLAVMMSYCGNAFADPVLNKVLSTHSITLAWVDNTPPISWQLNGKPTGMAIDLCLDVVESLKKRYNTNINVKWMKIANAARFEVIASNQADILCAIAANTGQRVKLVNFSTPWFYSKMNYLTRKSDNIMNTEMLAGHTVGAISGGTSAQVLTEMNQLYNYSISVKLVRDFDEGFNLLEEGHISAFVTDDIIILGKLSNLAEKEKYQMSPEGYGDELAYGLVAAKNANDMMDIINEEIKFMFRSGRFDKLYNKWFMSPGQAVQQPMSAQLIEQKNRILRADDITGKP